MAMTVDSSLAHQERKAAPEAYLSNGPYRPRPGRAVRPLKPLPLTGYDVLTRILNRVVAAALLVLTAPLLVLAAAFVKLTSRGPVLYTQTRLGLLGKPFTIYKIRSMYHDCERYTGAQWSQPGDHRVMPVGRFLRRTHLDEVPQLWNVLRGDMSLIGPRPERPEFVPELERAIPRYRDRLLVLPGVTGLAQVQLPPDTCIESVRTKVTYDLFYVWHRGFWLDLRILVGTLFKVLGFPWHVSRRLLLFPDRDAIESTYRRQTAEPAASVA
jgi:lipopolysaccharide/colanic/teichoic acid biosynthesis glycosyltransferase